MALEAIVNSPFTTVVVGPANTPLTDAMTFINGTQASSPITVAQLGTTNRWSVSFTPTTTGVLSLFAFGVIQVRLLCVSKSLYSFLGNLEDEALGSWTWNKSTGVLTLLRQNGSVLATHNIVDNVNLSSRERIT